MARDNPEEQLREAVDRMAAEDQSLDFRAKILGNDRARAVGFLLGLLPVEEAGAGLSMSPEGMPTITEEAITRLGFSIYDLSDSDDQQ